MSKVNAARRMLEELKLFHPLPEDVDLTLTLVAKPYLQIGPLGKEWAQFECDTRTKKVELTVSTARRKQFDVLVTVGHEYYHAMQWFLEGLHRTALDDWNEFMLYEAHAEGFGYRTASLYIAGQE
jgi:hypothetical protein